MSSEKVDAVASHAGSILGVTYCQHLEIRLGRLMCLCGRKEAGPAEMR